MNKLHKLVVVGLVGASVLVTVAPTFAEAGPIKSTVSVVGDPSQWGVTGDPSQWGMTGDPSQWAPSFNFTKIVYNKVNEYEGQHRLVIDSNESAVVDPNDATEDELLTRKVNEYEGQHRKVNEYEGQHRKVNEYEGQHRLTAEEEAESLLTRKVNEYEGQHRLTAEEDTNPAPARQGSGKVVQD